MKKKEILVILALFCVLCFSMLACGTSCGDACGKLQGCLGASQAFYDECVDECDNPGSDVEERDCGLNCDTGLACGDYEECLDDC